MNGVTNPQTRHGILANNCLLKKRQLAKREARYYLVGQIRLVHERRRVSPIGDKPQTVGRLRNNYQTHMSCQIKIGF